MIAFDCIGPRSARIKVYTRSYQVNINNICDMFTLGGQLTDPAMLKGSEILKDILPHLPALEGHRAKDSILTPPNRLHPRGGFVAAYEFTPDHPVPEVKVYIPVWCYAVMDKAVGEGLAGWLAAAYWVGCRGDVLLTGSEGDIVSYIHLPCRGRVLTGY